jgi:hypothetical protein
VAASCYNNLPSLSIQGTSEVTESDLDAGILETSNLENPEASSSQGERHLQNLRCGDFCNALVDDYYSRDCICRGSCAICEMTGKLVSICMCEVNPGIANYVGNFVSCVKFSRKFDIL